MKRCGFFIPDEMFDRLNLLAGQRQDTITDLLLRFISIGLILEEISRTPNAELIVRRGKCEEPIEFP